MKKFTKNFIIIVFLYWFEIMRSQPDIAKSLISGDKNPLSLCIVLGQNFSCSFPKMVIFT